MMGSVWRSLFDYPGAQVITIITDIQLDPWLQLGKNKIPLSGYVNGCHLGCLQQSSIVKMYDSLVFLDRFLGRIVKLQYTHLCMSLHMHIFIHIRVNIPWMWNAGLGINSALDYIKIIVGQSFKPQFSFLVQFYFIKLFMYMLLFLFCFVLLIIHTS